MGWKVKAGLAASLIGAAAAGSFLWGFFEGRKTSEENLSACKARFDQMASALEHETENSDELRQRIMEDASYIAALEAREPKERIIHKIERIPADCEKCLAGWRLPLAADTAFAWCGTDDAFTENLEIELKESYNRELLEPYANTISELRSEIAAREKYYPVRFLAEAEGAYGFFGAWARPALMLETGRKIRVGLGAAVLVDVDPMGDTRINPAALVKISWRAWP